MSSVLEKGLFAVLSGNSPQTSAGSRIYPRLPQGVTFPAIRYTRIATDRTQSLNANVGVTVATVAILCGAESFSEAKTLADEVRTILHGYSGAWSTLLCHNCSLDDEDDSQVEQEGDRVTHWVAQVYRVWTDMD